MSLASLNTFRCSNWSKSIVHAKWILSFSSWFFFCLHEQPFGRVDYSSDPWSDEWCAKTGEHLSSFCFLDESKLKKNFSMWFEEHLVAVIPSASIDLAFISKQVSVSWTLISKIFSLNLILVDVEQLLIHE